MNPEVIKHAVCSLYYTPDIQAFDWLEVVEGQMKYNHMSVIFFFLSDKNSPQKGGILWKLPKWTEISATTRSTLEIKNQQISLVQSKKAVSYIQNKYLISVQQNFALLWIQHLEKQLWQQAKAGSLRGKYFRINRRTPRLRVSFNWSYKLKE